MARFATALLALAVLASSAMAVPVRQGGRLNFAPDIPRSHVRNVVSGTEFVAPAPASFAPVSPIQAGLDFVPTIFAENEISYMDYVITDSYTTEHNGVTHLYLRQVIDDYPVFNANININVAKDGSIINYGNSFYAGDFAPTVNARSASFRASSSRISPLEAMESFASFIGKSTNSFAADEAMEVVAIDDKSALIEKVPFALNSVPAKLVYIQSNGALKLGWELTVEMEDNWFNAVVDAADGEVLATQDWVSDASYNVYPFGVNDPEEGSRALVRNPEDSKASPLGWHDNGSTKFTVTRGNNVNAQENLSGGSTWETNRRPQGGSSLAFDFPINLTKEPDTYLDAAVSQLFYTNNMIHDLFYQYGFNEVSGNFQDDNFGKGGKGGDGVIANAQDGSGNNNANFATPPDGQRGRMRMYTWTPTPKRDGDLEAGIVIHEYAHGISTRLTGGPANSNCLGSGESGGMGEGWGDFFATLIRQRKGSRITTFPMGAYSSRNPNGIRKYPYSPNMSVNPETYSYINRSGYSGVHAKGEIWANILFEALLLHVDAHGFSENLRDAKSSAGNVVLLQNVVDGLKLQPCSPTFVDARDAILLADKVNYGSKHSCLLWKAFAKRGLGVGAQRGGVDSFALPAGC